jgi:hypothetical protein
MSQKKITIEFISCDEREPTGEHPDAANEGAYLVILKSGRFAIDEYGTKETGFLRYADAVEFWGEDMTEAKE